MWITRSKHGILSLFVNDYPHRAYNEQWLAYSDGHLDCEYRGVTIEKNIFPELKWEDEPVEVELALKQ